MRKLLSIMMVVLLTIGLLPMKVEAAAIVEVYGWRDLQAALCLLNSNIRLMADVKYETGCSPLVVPKGITISLDLNGHIIDRGLTEAVDDGCVITVLGQLNIYDNGYGHTHDPEITYTDPIDNTTVTVNGGIITGGNNAKNGGGGGITNKGVLMINGGAIIGNSGSEAGAVYNAEGATLTVAGGQLLGNTATKYSGGAIINYGSAFINNGAVISGNTALDSGREGGAIWNKGQLVINGGTISRNKAVNGGALCNKKSTTIQGGKITENYATENGGGIIGNGGFTNSIVKMSGGEISKNQALQGGGVFINNGKFSMSGGGITDNMATSKAEYCGGGGVCVNDNARFTLTGGVISGNEAVENGGGILTKDMLTINGNNVLITKNKAKYGGGLYGRPPEPEKMAGRTEMYSGTISENYATFLGGGVYVQARYSFKMYGGYISKNEVGNADNAKDGMAGGLYASKNAGEVSLEGGMITENTAPRIAGGVYAECQLVVSGNTTIRGNVALYAIPWHRIQDVYLTRGENLRVIGKLSGTIGLYFDPNKLGYVATSGLNGKGGKENFVSNNTGYVIDVNTDKEAVLKAIDYNLLVDTNSEHGTISVNKSTATIDERVYLNVSPDPGYELDKVVNIRPGGSLGAVVQDDNGAWWFYMPPEDVVLAATFKEKMCSVTFVDDDGTILKAAKQYKYGTELWEYTKPDQPTKPATAQYTYTFAGWTPKLGKITDDVVYTATYNSKVNKYKVTFMDEDGKTILKEATEYDYGTTAGQIVNPKTPTKKGNVQYSYEFAGWSPKVGTVTGDITYTATYNTIVNKYTVFFVDEDGKTVLKAATKYDYGTPASSIEKPADPTKKATAQYTYTFAGWTPDIDEVTGDITYTATYSKSINKYTVTFVDEDGKTVLKAATEYDYGTPASSIEKPADPTKKATAQYTYTFAGWTPEIDAVTGDITYTATYSSVVNKYKVTFVDEDGTTVLKTATEYDYGTPASSIEKPADPTKKATAQYTYTFAGWTPKIDAVTGDITYTATYSNSVNKYTVTFVDEDGKTILKPATQYDYGTPASSIEKPADPTKEATAQYTYTFAGWTPAIDEVTGDITYTATYSKTVNQYTVTFVDEDGKTILKAATSYDYGTPSSAIEKPTDPTKIATAQYTYTFAGWTPEIGKVTEDITYKATYSSVLNKFKVTFVDEDRTTVLKAAVAYDYGTTFSDFEKPKDPTKAATMESTYIFVGWTPETDAVTGDITYIATYSVVVNKYKVIYVDDDGITILKDAIEYAFGTSAADYEKPADPEKKATAQYTYHFTGWKPQVDTTTGDITYIATYSSVVNKYKVTFVDEDGKTILKDAIAYDYGTAASVIAKPEVPTKEATAQYSYTFAGWTPQIDAVTGDITYKATYSSVVNKYKVTFVDEDETTILKDTVEYDYGTAEKDIVKPEDPTKQATEQYTYTFAGWTPEINVVTGDITYVATYEAEEIIAPPVISYIVKRGADGSWIQNDSVGYTLAADRIGDDQKCSDHYVATWIDQKKVPVSTKEGSIIITIAPETLKELSVGEHTIKVEFDDGSVETKLTVKAAPEPDAPIAAPTGNDGYLWLWIYALGASLASMAVMGLSGKKRRVK